MKRILLAALVLLLAAVAPSQAREKTILIKGGLVYDGTGAEPRKADILVKGGKIAAIEADIPESKADNVIDAKGEIVAPGFIETPMTQQLPEEVRKDWMSKIPLRRGGTDLDVAKTSLYLASDLSAYVTGQVLSVDGGLVLGN